MKAQAPVYCSCKNGWHSVAFRTTNMNSNRWIWDYFCKFLMKIPVKAFQGKCVLILFTFKMEFLIIYQDARPVTSLLYPYTYSPFEFSEWNETSWTSNHVNDILKLNKTIGKCKCKKRSQNRLGYADLWIKIDVISKNQICINFILNSNLFICLRNLPFQS